MVNAKETEEGLLVGLAFVRGLTRPGTLTFRSLDERGKRLRVKLPKEMVSVLPGCWIEELMETDARGK